MSIYKFYLWRHNVLIPHMVQTDAGLYVDAAPVAICNASDSRQLYQKIKESLSLKIVQLPPPIPAGSNDGDCCGCEDDQDDSPHSVLLAAVDLTKWEDFEKETTLYTVHVSQDEFIVYSTGRDKTRMWTHEASRKTVIARTEGIEAVTQRVLAEITADYMVAQEKRTRTGLPAPRD